MTVQAFLMTQMFVLPARERPLGSVSRKSGVDEAEVDGFLLLFGSSTK